VSGANAGGDPAEIFRLTMTMLPCQGLKLAQNDIAWAAIDNCAK
jgi:hypothetical protein